MSALTDPLAWVITLTWGGAVAAFTLWAARTVLGWRKPGTPGEAYDTLPSADEKPPAAGERPAAAPAQAPPPPGLTAWERGVLATLATTPLCPQGAGNGREVADMARQTIGHLPDTDLGRAVLQAYWWAAVFHRFMPPAAAMHATLDALAAAALDLTALDRNEVPR